MNVAWLVHREVGAAVVAQLRHSGDENAVVGHGGAHGGQEGLLRLHGDTGLLALPPFRRHFRAAVGAGRRELGHLGQQRFQRRSGVAVDSEGVGIVAAQLFTVHVYLDNLLASQPEGEGQPRAHGQHQVVAAVLSGNGVIAQPQRTQRQRMPVGDDALAFGGSDDRHLQVFGQLPHCIGSPGGYGAAASPDERVLRRRQHPRRLGDATGIGSQGTGSFRLQQLNVSHFRQRFGRNLDLDGSRSAVLHMMERFMHRLRHFRRVHCPPRELGDRLHDVQLVVNLVEHTPVDSDQVALNLPRHHQHGR